MFRHALIASDSTLAASAVGAWDDPAGPIIITP